MMTIQFQVLEKGDSQICEKILRSLPDWFGIESALQRYIKDSVENPMVVAKNGDKVLGFCSLLNHGPHSSEIYVMGIFSEYHRQGLGRKIIQQAERYLKANGFEFLQVKTVDETRENEVYMKTRLFYQSMGFKKLEVFPDLWDEHNPCLLLVKSL